MSAAGSRLVLLVLAASLNVAGCLPEDPPVQGRLLHAGVGILRPEFRYLDGQPWVQFEVRQARSDEAMGARSSVHLLNWQDPSLHKVLLDSRSQRKEWPRLEDTSGALFYMTEDPRSDPAAPPVGTLVRLSLTQGPVETIPDVLGYLPLYDGNQRVIKFQYRKRVPGTNLPELHLRDLSGQDRNLGLDVGQTQFVGEDRLYYIGGEDRMFTRLADLNAPPEELRGQVDGFTLHGSERLVVLNVSQQGKSLTVLHDLTTGEERLLPVEQPSKSLGLRGDTLIWTQRAGAGRPTRLHYLNIISGEGQSYELPEGIPDVATLVNRGSESLVFDSKGRLTILRPEADPPFEGTSLQPAAPSFSPDGRFLLYIEAEAAPPLPGMNRRRGGQLRVQSTADWQESPRLLSPRGTSVPLAPAGFGLRPEDPDFPLFFWARYGLSGSDLYVANYDSGAVVKVATGIGSVAIGERHVLGIVRLTQDQTGDLMYREFSGNRERVVEHGVSEVTISWFEELGDLVAFVVRERLDSSARNGLWATTLEPPPAPVDPPAAARRVASRWTMVEGAEERVAETAGDSAP